MVKKLRWEAVAYWQTWQGPKQVLDAARGGYRNAVQPSIYA